jgi:hypothetical protein
LATPPQDQGESAAQDVIASAAHAPSVHNTQPWLFTTQVAEDDVVVELRAERSRALPVLDPDGRQLMISCGAALDHALVAARAAGLPVSVAVLPDGDQPDLLARLSWPRSRAEQPADAELAAAIGQRHTYRDRFTPEPVDPAELDVLREAARDAGCWLEVVLDPDDVLTLEVLLARADEQQRRDPAYQEELAAWTHAPEGSGFGVPETNLDPAGGAGSSLALRDFEGRHDDGAPPAADPPTADRPTVVVLGTDGDEIADWLAAGRALSEVLLQATQAGLAAQPLGQVTDNLGWRTRLGHALQLSGYVQMVLRLGHPAHAVPSTPRHDPRR